MSILAKTGGISFRSFCRAGFTYLCDTTYIVSRYIHGDPLPRQTLPAGRGARSFRFYRVSVRCSAIPQFKSKGRRGVGLRDVIRRDGDWIAVSHAVVMGRHNLDASFVELVLNVLVQVGIGVGHDSGLVGIGV